MLRAVVDEHEGVLVKTMGDAIMAAFVDAHACARAAADVLTRFETFRAAHPQGALVGLKVGLFAGACYIVTANGALDYFGQTVNVASRVQHLAGAGEVVMAHALWESLPDAVQTRFALKERFRANVKGVAEALDLARVALAST